MGDDMNRAMAYQRHAISYPLDELRLEVCALKDGKWISTHSTDLVLFGHLAADFDSVLNLMYAKHYLDMSLTQFRWELWHHRPKAATKVILATGVVLIPHVRSGRDRPGEVVTWAYTQMLKVGLMMAHRDSKGTSPTPNVMADRASDFALSAMRTWDQDLHGTDPWLKDDWSVGRDGELIEYEPPRGAWKDMGEIPIIPDDDDEDQTTGKTERSAPPSDEPSVAARSGYHGPVPNVQLGDGESMSSEWLSNVAVGYPAERALPQWAQSFVSIDTETTGLGEDARVLSVAAVVFHRGHVVERWECAINPDVNGRVDWDSEGVRGALKVNGKTRYEIQAAADPDYALRKLARQFANAAGIGAWHLAGHHLQYDVRMLFREFDIAKIHPPQEGSQLREKMSNMTMLDTKSLFVAAYGLQERHRLKQICEWLKVPIMAHTAIGDAEAAGHVLVKLALSGKLPNDLHELLRVQSDAEAKWRAAHPEYK